MCKSQKPDTRSYEILRGDVFCKSKDRYELWYS